MTMKPKIGIFWIHKSKIYLKSIGLDQVKVIDGFKDSDFGHYQVWDEMSAQNKELYIYEYEDIPRGRIVYNVNHGLFIVYSNEDIINSDEAKKLIMDAFGLNDEAVSFQYDAHYKIKGKF